MLDPGCQVLDAVQGSGSESLSDSPAGRKCPVLELDYSVLIDPGMAVDLRF